MCIAFFTTSQPGYKLIIASNRDEFYDRPAAPADWHFFGLDVLGAESTILCGRDEAASGKGTWMGMTRDLRIGLITNIRDPGVTGAAVRRLDAPSRGQLLRSYLQAPPTKHAIRDFITTLPPLDLYDGFNLLLFQVSPAGAVSELISNRPRNRVGALEQWFAGTRGISNTPMEQPWPKVVNGQHAMNEELQEWTEKQEDEDALLRRLFRVLQQSVDFNSLTDAPWCTCIPPFNLAGRWYGTRVSTIILVSDKDEVTFVERPIGGLDVEAANGLFDEVDSVAGIFLDEPDRVFRFTATPIV